MLTPEPDAGSFAPTYQKMDSLYSSADRGTTFAEEAVARLSERLSDILPKKLATRFSEAYKQQQQHVKALQQKVKAPFAAVSTSSNAQPLKVYIRVRPLQPSDAVGNPSLATTVQPASSTELSVQPPANGFRKGAAAFTYTFSTVFQPDATQAAYFDATTAPLVRQLLDFRHRSSVLMAYGSSGTGKTYSMEGPPEQPGILPRALHAVFEGLRQQRSAAAATTVSVSYCEFYNDVVYDLLEPENSGRLAGLKIRRPLRVREDGGGQVVVPGLTEVVVRSAEEALELQRAASRQRQQATTRINSLSSRSHAVFTIRLAQPASAELSLPVERGGGAAATAGGLERTSQLSFVDLAGSERADRTQNAGDRFKESVSINTSLMTLGRCLEALKHNQQACAAASAAAAAAGGGGGAGSTATAAAGPAVKVVPYRESKLTHLFRDVLLGWGNFVLCVNVSPSASDFEETHHVLKYAALATSISLAPQPAALVAAAAPAAVEPGTVLRGHNNNKGAAAAARAAAACPPTQFRQHALVAAAAGGLHGRRAGAAVTSAAAATAAAAEEALAVAESKLQHVRHENLEMRLRMEEMEEELGNLMTQLAAAERQLAEAEAEIREEVSHDACGT